MHKNQWYILSQEPCGSEGSFILFLQLMLLTKTINKPVTKNGIENKNKKKKMQMALLLRGGTLGDSSFRLCSFTSTSSSLHVSQNVVIPNSPSSPILPLVCRVIKKTYSIYLCVYLSIYLSICIYVYAIISVHMHAFHSIDKNYVASLLVLV
jgi:hypothetical protein